MSPRLTSPPSTRPPRTNPAAQAGQIVGSLPSAMLLAGSGGALDAFIYINHGHVFAAAMTGNAVLLGATALQHNWMLALHHLVPILAFVVGVFLSQLLDARLGDRAVPVGLLGEITILFALSWASGRFPDVLFVPIVSLVAAYQVASFRRADTFGYNSTFITGNLRTAVDGLFQALSRHNTRPTRRAGLRKFRSLALIIAAFLVGAIAGALLAPRLLNRTLWIVDLPLVLVLGRTLYREAR